MAESTEDTPAPEPPEEELPEPIQLPDPGYYYITDSEGLAEAVDALRGSSVALFKRVFSENQAPNEGVQLDQPRTHPLPHRGDQLPDPFYDDLWGRFWDYANDPELAASKGVRAIHGEAPSIELREGKTYRIELRSSGGLSIKVE